MTVREEMVQTEQIDLNEVIQTSRYTLEASSPEYPEERNNRLRIEAEDARHVRWRVTGVYALCIISLIAITIIAAYVTLNSSSSPQAKSWAQSLLAAMVTGPLGFVIGSKVKFE